MWIASQGGLYIADETGVRDYFQFFYSDRAVDLDRLLRLEHREDILRGLKDMLDPVDSVDGASPITEPSLGPKLDH